jgi:hypothetical protein
MCAFEGTSSGTSSDTSSGASSGASSDASSGASSGASSEINNLMALTVQRLDGHSIVTHINADTTTLGQVKATAATEFGVRFEDQHLFGEDQDTLLTDDCTVATLNLSPTRPTLFCITNTISWEACSSANMEIEGEIVRKLSHGAGLATGSVELRPIVGGSVQDISRFNLLQLQQESKCYQSPLNLYHM